ncbi:hypothetical protein [Formosa haliotis]|uniref:hypothetical protein n=1 Tax=Formosa haliotis TaxID=1555194 RepID=UPI0009F16380|nr:hypothetical protein [Formosa haliotis]
MASEYFNSKLGVPVIFDAFYFSELRKLGEDIGAQSVLKSFSSHVIRCKPDMENFDLDTKSDYDELYSKTFDI